MSGLAFLKHTAHNFFRYMHYHITIFSLVFVNTKLINRRSILSLLFLWKDYINKLKYVESNTNNVGL